MEHSFFYYLNVLYTLHFIEYQNLIKLHSFKFALNDSKIKKMGNYYSADSSIKQNLIKNDFNICLTLTNKNKNNCGILRDRNIKQYMKTQKFKDLINSRLANCQNKPKMKKCLSILKENDKYLLNINLELENLEYTEEVSVSSENRKLIINSIKEEINKEGIFWEDSKKFEHFLIKDIHLLY